MNHFTILHWWLNLLAHKNDIDWSRWFHRNCYFKHCYFYTYSTNGCSIDCRSVHKGDSVKSGQLNDILSRNSHLPAHTAPQLPQVNCLHSPFQDTLPPESKRHQRNSWQPNNAHNCNTSEHLLLRACFQWKNNSNFFWRDTSLNFYFVQIKFATGGM